MPPAMEPTEMESVPQDSTTKSRPRGRPSKPRLPTEAATHPSTTLSDNDNTSPPPQKRKRGRPAKAKDGADPKSNAKDSKVNGEAGAEEDTPLLKKRGRGRPPKTKVEGQASAKTKDPKAEGDNEVKDGVSVAKKRGRGRPAKAKIEVAKVNAEDDEVTKESDMEGSSSP